MSRARIISASSKSPAVKIFPAAIETPEYPPPQWEYFQSNRGPPSGHFFSRPFSVEMFDRPAPWNSGQVASLLSSLAGNWPACTSVDATTAPATKPKIRFHRMIAFRRFRG